MYQLWIVWYAIVLHWVWGCTLLASSAPLNITAIASITRLGAVSPELAGVLYMLVALLAMIGLTAPRVAGILFLLPQQLVMMVSAYGALTAMLTGQFADGITRSHYFLIADQAPAVIAAILHLLAVYGVYWDTRVRTTNANH